VRRGVPFLPELKGVTTGASICSELLCFPGERVSGSIEGRRPRWYSAVYSQEDDRRVHSVQGCLPVHLIFLLFGCQPCSLTPCTSERKTWVSCEEPHLGAANTLVIRESRRLSNTRKLIDPHLLLTPVTSPTNFHPLRTALSRRDSRRGYTCLRGFIHHASRCRGIFHHRTEVWWWG
jgi:hypothetical protein